jgi:Skp family chaperone for outer membrane proteins
MRLLKMMIVVGAVSAIAAGPVLAQTPPPPTKPPAQTPPATPAQPPADKPAPTPPKPFPEGAKIGFIDINLVAAKSAEGIAANAKIQEFTKKRMAELQDKNKKLEDLKTKAAQSGPLMNDQAAAQLQKEIEKGTRELQFAQQEANAEQQQLENDLRADFSRKLNPVLAQIGEEKGLHMILEIQAAGAVWAHSGLDLTQEVIKRLDAGKAPVKK